MSRNRIPFGYTTFGGVILVKLNCKISAEQALGLVKKYPNLVTWGNGKYGISTRVLVAEEKIGNKWVYEVMIYNVVVFTGKI